MYHHFAQAENQNLSGTLPSELGQLNSLSVLSLGKCAMQFLLTLEDHLC